MLSRIIIRWKGRLEHLASRQQDQTRLAFGRGLRPKLVPKLALYFPNVARSAQFHLLGAADTLCLGFASKTSINLQ